MSATTSERVLVVPTSHFHRLGHFQGFSHDADRYLDGLLKPEQVQFLPRDEVEQDPGFKQLIPYVLFRCQSSSGETLLQYTRGRGQGESRLHDKRSVGIGGHIAAADAAGGNDPYGEGMQREIGEEVDIQTAYSDRRVGLINDDETEVGSVHLGIVHLFDVQQPAVYPRETEIADCGFRAVADILDDIDQFETWSQICLKALFQ